MNPSPFLILSAAGGIVTIISFFLPWVRANFLDQVLPIVGPLLGLFNQELKALVEQFRHFQNLNEPQRHPKVSRRKAFHNAAALLRPQGSGTGRPLLTRRNLP